MKAQTLDTQEAQTRMEKYRAVMDAKRRNSEMSHTFSAAQKNRAQVLINSVREAYSHKGVYINYREKFIAVKLNGARVKNRALVNELESKWSREGITKAVSMQGVIYRIPKA